jgi:hypothetical protein
MSKQLAISASFATFAMAAFALFAAAGGPAQLRSGVASVPAGIETPAWLGMPRPPKRSLLGG